MKSLKIALVVFLLPIGAIVYAQPAAEKKVIVTGARFTYPLLEKWIGEYREANPSVEVRIEPRTTTDPSQYDLLIEAFEPEKTVQGDREYLYIGRYAVLPVANAKSAFAKTYSEKGLTSDLIKQIFFHDIYTSKDKQQEIETSYTVYTRLQKAGAPKTFASYFGYEQQQIKGKSIAGADEHLIKALLKDSTGVSYNNLGLIYDLKTRTVSSGLAILPVDADDNGRVSKDEKFYGNLDEVLTRLEEEKIKNVPVEYFHISIRKHAYNPEALRFLQWIIENSQEDLHAFGFLKPEQKRFDAEKEKFEQLALK
jgi:phosphate transport system substrate-binding protein